MRRARRLAILSAASAALMLPAAASADKASVGANLQFAPIVNSNNFCTNPCTITQLTGEPQFGTFTAPNDATITSWSMRTMENGITYNLRVMTKIGGSYLAKATSAPIASTVAADTTYTSGPVSIPIAAGDQLGLQSNGPGNNQPGLGAPMMSPNQIDWFSPNIADGATLPPSGMPFAPWINPVRAEIIFCKVPTVTGQTEAAARAAITVADCAHGTATKQRLQLRALKRIPKGASKKKKKKIRARNAAINTENARLRTQNGIVLAQGTAPGTVYGSPPGPGVALTVGEVVEAPTPKKKKKKKKK